MVEFLTGVALGFLLGLYTASKKLRRQANNALKALLNTARRLEVTTNKKEVNKETSEKDPEDMRHL